MENGAISENSCSSQLIACLQLTGPKLMMPPCYITDSWNQSRLQD